MDNNFPTRLLGTAAPVDMWANEWGVEAQALQQLRRIADLPWTHRVAVMPDVHLGKGATVGSVIAMRNAVSPSAVGVDIGCGMTGVKTDLMLTDLPDDLHQLRLDIEAAIPTGFNSYDGTSKVLRTNNQLSSSFNSLFKQFGSLKASNISDRESRALSQCGTLGGGNHFIEVTVDTDGYIWLMLHSGSRNIGKELAERHINTAKGLEHNIGLPDRDLAVFLTGTPEIDAYRHDLYWAQDYALLNRRVMMATLIDVMRKHFPAAKFDADIVECHHNYVSEETYDGLDLIVTRKGAISARKNEMGLIPGSMGTGSYVVRGLGNATGLNSASHGAGRKMSRSKAKQNFTLDDLAQQTSGVECRKDQGVLDEIPGAYKDLESVIAAESTGPSPLVEVVTRLTTLLCVKG